MMENDNKHNIDLVSELKDYFNNTPEDQQKKDWEEICEKLKFFNKIGKLKEDIFIALHRRMNLIADDELTTRQVLCEAEGATNEIIDMCISTFSEYDEVS